MSAPRVLVSGLVLGQPMGGVRRHNQELLPRAARLLAEAGGGLAVVLSRAGTEIELPAPIQVLGSRAPAGPPLARALAEGRVLRAALRAARARGPAFDLVHTAHLPAPGRLPVPYSLTLHDLRALAGPDSSGRAFARLGRPLATQLVARAVARAAAVCAVSESVRAELEARFAPRRTFLVPNAGDHLPLRPRSAAPDAALLHVGHLEPRKNLELLLQALAQDPGLPDLLLAGAPKHGHDARLARLARALGVQERLRVLGPVPEAELPDLYARCAAVVLPSRLEGFGIGVLEAQRARAPLAVARTPALLEVAGPGVPSFAPDDPAGCARAIRAALARPAAALAADAGRAARYRWQASAEALVAAWTGALARSPEPGD